MTQTILPELTNRSISQSYLICSIANKFAGAISTIILSSVEQLKSIIVKCPYAT